MSKPQSNVILEVGHSAFHVAFDAESVALPLERNGNGRLTDDCRERLTNALKAFLTQKARGVKNAWCAVNARGVSMRRLNLPASSPEELQRVLRLQIESEFPLSPEELAWGTQSLARHAGREDVLVVAVKKDAFEEYRAIFAACGIASRFTLAALARAEIQKPPAGGSSAFLDIGHDFSELLLFDNGLPVSVRVIQNAAGEAEAGLARSLRFLPAGTRLYLTGKAARQAQFVSNLSAALGGIPCESLERDPSPAPTAAIAGLAKIIARQDTSTPLILEAGGGQPTIATPRPAVWKWAAAAVFLALGTLLFPFAEAIVMKPFLEKKLAKLESDRGRLAVIDEELDFLKFVKQNQPPYLDAIYLLARSAPPGSRMNSLAMGRHQDISMSFHFGNSQQVSDYRTKLVESGWFSDVMVEEQSQPEQDHSVNIRMTATLKPVEARKPITTNSVDKAMANGWGGPDYSGSQPQPMMMPQPGPAQMTPGDGPVAHSSRRHVHPAAPQNP